MKKIYLLTLFCMLNVIVVAQQNIIKRDTINISGYIYDNAGRPLQNQYIHSCTSDIQYNRFPNSTVTDSAGHFVIKGAKFNDTLSISTIAYKSIKYYNKGSRFIKIFLIPNITEINSQTPVQITATRRHRIKTPSFKIKDDDIIICGVENSPEFPGGADKYIRFINNNISYPEKAIENNIEGSVKIRFTVERDGTVINPQVIQGIGYGCDEIVIAAVKHSPRWKPGQINGRVFKMQYEVSVEFKLTDK